MYSIHQGEPGGILEHINIFCVKPGILSHIIRNILFKYFF